MKPISEWPLDDRPREKLLKKGAAALSDAELLAIFLRTGVQGVTAVDLARELLDRFDGLNHLLSASRVVFCQGKGLGEAKYAQLQAVLEMGRRYLYEELTQGDPITSSTQAQDFLRVQMQGYKQEVFACLFLDNKHRVLQFTELFHGTLDSASIYPREVIKEVLECHAAAVIFAHNHPSGDPQPSSADVEITQRLQKALGYIDVRVLDHLVIAEEGVISLAEHGDLLA